MTHRRVISALMVVATAWGASQTQAPAASRRTTKRAVTGVSVPSSLVVDASKLPEVSGCAVSRRDQRTVWLHNDSGDAPRLFAVDLVTGKVGPAVALKGIEADDTEDIAISQTGQVVLADIGDNAESRGSVSLDVFPEPAAGATSATPATLELRYPDRPHNAEALIVTPDGASAWIITKTTGGVAEVFAADLRSSGPQTVVKVGTITITGEGFIFPNLITAADVLGNGRGIVLRTYQYGYLLSVPVGRPFADVLTVTPKRFDLPAMAQAEALCSNAAGTWLVTASEARGAAKFPIAVIAAPR